MASKALLSFGFLLSIALLISAQVSARELAEETNKLNGNDLKDQPENYGRKGDGHHHGGGHDGHHGGGYDGHHGGGHDGHHGGGHDNHYGKGHDGHHGGGHDNHHKGGGNHGKYPPPH